MHRKEGLKTFAKLITPSLFEFLGVLIIFLIFFISHQVHQQYPNDLANMGVGTFKGTILGGLARWIDVIYRSNEFSILGLYIFWLFIALLVYIMAVRFTRNVEEVADDIRIRHYLWPRGTNRDSPLKEYIEKFGIKLVVLFTLFLYLMKLSPLLINWWKRHYIFVGDSLHSLTIYITLLVFMMLYVHGLVILIRALILRLRIFNF